MPLDTFGARYRAHLKGNPCPIESGVMLALADNECKCGRLPSDPTPACGCWPNESPKPARGTGAPLVAA